MSQFHYHPDKLIYVRTEKGTYCDTVTNFALDFGRTWPWPEGISELIYEEGAKLRHVAFDLDGNQLARELPFPFGDAAIAAIDKLLESQAKRNTPSPPAGPPPMPPHALVSRKAPSPSTGTNKV